MTKASVRRCTMIGWTSASRRLIIGPASAKVAYVGDTSARYCAVAVVLSDTILQASDHLPTPWRDTNVLPITLRSIDWSIEQCFASPPTSKAPTQYRLYGIRFLQVKRPNQQYQSTEGESCKGKQVQCSSRPKIWLPFSVPFPISHKPTSPSSHQTQSGICQRFANTSISF